MDVIKTEDWVNIARIVFGFLLIGTVVYAFLSKLITYEQFRDFLVFMVTARGVAIGGAAGIQALRNIKAANGGGSNGGSHPRIDYE